MRLLLSLSDKTYLVSDTAIDISIPLHFNEAQPNSYGVPTAVSKAFEGGGFVGDVRQGGSCNFETYTLTPHCNGTHTECVGHITSERISIHQRLQTTWIPATLISLLPLSPSDTSDTYSPDFQPEDNILTKSLLENALASVSKETCKALIIRTLPNPLQKQTWQYPPQQPPFFSIEAMQFLREIGVEHLLIDTPSVDRLLDEGKLSAHHVFFNIASGMNKEQNSVTYTITEFIYVPNEVLDGIYLLNLQVAPFESDAAPSRPRIFALSET